VKGNDMITWMLLYLMVGVCWGLLMYHKHPVMIELKARIGDERLMLVILACYAVLWPIDIMLLISHLIARRQRAGPRDLGVARDGDGFGLVCYNCGAVHRWLGSNEKMEEIGWKMVRDSGDPSHVYWFCKDCDIFPSHHGENT
jgi:hypothetical protein